MTVLFGGNLISALLRVYRRNREWGRYLCDVFGPGMTGKK